MRGAAVDIGAVNTVVVEVEAEGAGHEKPVVVGNSSGGSDKRFMGWTPHTLLGATAPSSASSTSAVVQKKTRLIGYNTDWLGKDLSVLDKLFMLNSISLSPKLPTN